MIDFSTVRVGDKIKYITFVRERDVLVVCEISETHMIVVGGCDDPMLFLLDNLNPVDWELITEKHLEKCTEMEIQLTNGEADLLRHLLHCHLPEMNEYYDHKRLMHKLDAGRVKK